MFFWEKGGGGELCSIAALARDPATPCRAGWQGGGEYVLGIMRDYVLFGQSLKYVLNIRDFTGLCGAHISPPPCTDGKQQDLWKLETYENITSYLSGWF